MVANLMAPEIVKTLNYKLSIAMKKIGIFYGSSTGKTARVAQKLGNLLNISPNDIHDVSKTSPSALGEYDVILLGSSTWGAGELQTDWFDFSKALESMALTGKKIGVFGCGKQMMKNTFCNAVGIIYDIAQNTGATMIGEFNSDGYSFRKSKARFEDAELMKGLVLDVDTADELTDGRLKEWAEIIGKAVEE